MFDASLSDLQNPLCVIVQTKNHLLVIHLLGGYYILLTSLNILTLLLLHYNDLDAPREWLSIV